MANFHLTGRDRQIIAAVYTHRALTSDQVSVLFWGSAKAHTRSRHRLRLLSEHGFLMRGEQAVTLAEGRRPLVYFLEKPALEIVADELGIEVSEITWKPSHNNLSWPFLEHLLSTNDIRVRLEYAAPHFGLEIAAWEDDFSLTAAARRSGLTLIADGYVALVDPAVGSLHRAFIEADRGTVPLARWEAKVRQYLAYFASEDYARRYQATKPCRVLTVTTSQARLANMKRVAEQVGGAPWFWFATFEGLAEPERVLCEPAWQMAGVSDPVCFPYPPAARGVSVSEPVLPHRPDSRGTTGEGVT